MALLLLGSGQLPRARAQLGSASAPRKQTRAAACRMGAAVQREHAKRVKIAVEAPIKRKMLAATATYIEIKYVLFAI